MTSKVRSILCSSSERDSWLQERRKYVTASEVASVLGANRYQSAYELFAAKTSGVVAPVNHHMQRGIDNEHKVLATCGIRYRPWNKLIASRKYPWLAATIDGVGHEQGITYVLEAKCPARPWKTGEYKKYHAQVLTQMLATGIENAVLIEGIGPSYAKSKQYILCLADFDSEVAEILDKTYRFHRDLQRGVFGHDFWEGAL